MGKRLQAWMDETHGTGFELVRHFLARFFDSEMVTSSGEWQKVAIGVLATLLSAGILVLKTYFTRYGQTLYEQASGAAIPQLYRQWVRGDVLAFVAIAMAITALLTVLEWQSLFPTRQDYLTLAGLPVRSRQVFQAKFLALLLLFAGFVAALTVPPAASFTAATAGTWQENPSALVNLAANLCATAGACVFVFFTLLAVQGILLNVLPERVFSRVSPAIQAVVFIATAGALPLLGRQPASAEWWPPVWFLRLWEAMVTTARGSARNAILATMVPAAASVLAYLLSYHRYRRLLLEAPPERSVRGKAAGLRVLERWIVDPREQAVFAFIWKTLLRSRGHRLILMAYVGLALGWITKGALDTPRPSLRDQGMYGFLVVVAPLALSVLATVGLRYIFSLPVALRANWVFRIAEKGGRAAWLRALERFVVWCGIAPILAAGLPAAIAVLGWMRGTAAMVLTLLAALVWFEAMFRNWQKLPFTCSYLPGKRPVWLTLSQYCLMIPLLAMAGQLMLYASGEVTAFAALATFLAAVWWKLRAGRRSIWAKTALQFEEATEAPVMSLNLQPAAELRTGDSASAEQREAPMFSRTLVASRGIVPQAWAEEIEEDRRHPSLLFETFLEDVRYGFRLIRRSPVVSAVVVLTLTVGIGINASVFTVANGFALRPHLRRDPDSFVRVIAKARLRDRMRPVSYAEYTAFREHSRSVRQLAAYAHFPAFIGADDSVGTIGLAVSCNFFQVEGLDRAVLGRMLLAEDCLAPGKAPAVVISESIWRTRFAGDPGVIGKRLDLNNRAAIVVGVIPNGTAGWARGVGWTKAASVWLPYSAMDLFEPSSAATLFVDELWLQLAGRLAPGYSRSAAEAELTILARQQDRLRSGPATAIVTTDGSLLRELEMTMNGRDLMLLAFFMAAFNLVLLLACANVATLLLARAAVRKREIAVRLSLGAPRIRLVRMLVTESLLLAALAGAASIYLASRVPVPLFRLISGGVPDFAMPPDWHTFAYVAAAVMLAGVLAGLAPALESVKVDIARSLKGSAPGGSGIFGMRGPRLQDLLVSAQVAISMVLLTEAALFAGAEDRALRANPGYLSRRVVVAPLFFPEGTGLQTAAVRLLEISQRVKALPGVRAVAFSENIPLFDRTTVELRPPARPDASQPVDIYTASPAFFETMGVPLLRGREFQVTDRAAVIVSETLARQFWPWQDPIGKTLPVLGGGATVVGVVKDVDPLRFGGSENPALYRPWRIGPVRNVLSVRFEAGMAAGGGAAVRSAIRQIDPNMSVVARLAQTWIDLITADLWNVVALIVILGIIATLLATAGIYGAVSFAVNQRSKELGIRVALGARRPDIVGEVFRSGGKPVLKGLLAGLWLSAATAAGLRQSVSGSPIRLDTANPVLYVGAALLLGTAAILAMVAPARRGANSDPLEALRCE